MALALLADALGARAGGGRHRAHRRSPAAARSGAPKRRRSRAGSARRGIAHATLVRDGPPPRSGIQAAARAARYRLLEGWCREPRRAASADRASSRRSGRDPAAAAGARQRPRRARRHGGAGRARRSAACCGRCSRCRARGCAPRSRARGQDWIEDPSNRDPGLRPGAAAPMPRRCWPRTGSRPSGSPRPPRGSAGRARRSRRRWRALLARAVWLASGGLCLARCGAARRAAPDEVGLRGARRAARPASAAPTIRRGLRALERLHRALREGLAARPDARRLPRPAAPRPHSGLPRAGRGRRRRCRRRRAREVGWDGRFALRLPATRAGRPDASARSARDAPHSAPASAATAASGGGAADPAGAARCGRGWSPCRISVIVRPMPTARRLGRRGLYFRPTRPLTRAGFTVV